MGSKLIAAGILILALFVTFGDRLKTIGPNPRGEDEVSRAASIWEADVRSVYRDAAKQDFQSDKEAFDWLQVRMKAAVVHATEGIRKAEGDAAKDGWSADKARKNWERWGR